MSRSIDLNSDLGESFGPWNMGDDASMLSIVSSANIACGGHASDPETMFETLQLAKENGVTIGAHPGYNDREGFGRRIIPMTPPEIGRMVTAQIGALQALATLAGTEVSYVKPHGALGNLAAADRDVADAVVDAVRRLDTRLSILAISGMQLEHAARDAGVPVYSEIFADRGYLSSGQLVPRGQDGAMIHDPDKAADRLLAFLDSGLMPVIDGDPIELNAQSICVHGDSDGAVAMARTIRKRLTDASVTINGFIAR
ncbi:LamB/YcsF family protein [Litoreibacter arenae]|uniref:5-oxoprolinase subunit A n=1 Tax=Litoreibacter arenae DSM 19593 TaxID=1123360 RepID=S9QNI8_9RHOB|nr:5-oxoprolinase subunit PxpA [Litoreibacter arenae]EPX81153.1 Lactam utilization protein LamB [Litoreibacter arenae DSM 19593]